MITAREARGCWRLAVLAFAGALATIGGCAGVARLMMRAVLWQPFRRHQRHDKKGICK